MHRKSCDGHRRCCARCNGSYHYQPWLPGEVKVQSIYDSRRRVHWGYELFLHPKGVDDVEGYYRGAARRPTGLNELVDIDGQLTMAAAALQAQGTTTFINMHELLFSLGVAHTLDTTRRLCPKWTVFEISERLSPMVALQARPALRRWREDGFRYVMDDFVLTETHLELLFILRPDGLKLDRALVQSAQVPGPRRLALHTLVVLARVLGLTVLGEGVETLTEADRLTHSLGVLHHQGHWHHRPEALEPLLHTGHAGLGAPPEGFGLTRWWMLDDPEARKLIWSLLDGLRRAADLPEGSGRAEREDRARTSSLCLGIQEPGKQYVLQSASPINHGKHVHR